jgi:alkanesulfonate monooxygenase SsuD/methylene tetrahydromethanopterin reductase-like flavin-dependent oxidoreductase (luciferase family)
MDETRSPSTGVPFGLRAFCTEATLAPAELASAVEQEGFDVFLFPDHTHVPVDRPTPFPGGGALPSYYLRPRRC